MIIEREQSRQERAEFWRGIMRKLDIFLTKMFGRCFSITNLKTPRNFTLFIRVNSTNIRCSGKKAAP